MPELVKRPIYQVGDQVRIKIPSRWVGTITEARGSYHESGNVLYTVRVPLEPEHLWMLLHEDEIEKI